jgi:nucleotide-binding universal stress UspA family protein
MYKRIVVPLDGSSLGEAVLGCVAGVAKLNDADITLLSVIPPEGLFKAEDGPVVSDRADHNEDSLVRSYLQQKAAELRALGAKVNIDTVNGSPADALIKYTEEHNIDLIAMSTHGRSGVARAVMGSTADRISRVAKVPVMLVRSADACTI